NGLLAGISGDLAAAVDRHATDRLALERGVHERRAPVLGLLVLGLLVLGARDRLALAEADGDQALAVVALGDEPVRDREGALLGEGLVGGVRAVVVGVPL